MGGGGNCPLAPSLYGPVISKLPTMSGAHKFWFARMLPDHALILPFHINGIGHKFRTKPNLLRNGNASIISSSFALLTGVSYRGRGFPAFPPPAEVSSPH